MHQNSMHNVPYGFLLFGNFLAALSLLHAVTTSKNILTHKWRKRDPNRDRVLIKNSPPPLYPHFFLSFSFYSVFPFFLRQLAPYTHIRTHTNTRTQTHTHLHMQREREREKHTLILSFFCFS